MGVDLALALMVGSSAVGVALVDWQLWPNVVKAETLRFGELAQMGPSTPPPLPFPLPMFGCGMSIGGLIIPNGVRTG